MKVKCEWITCQYNSENADYIRDNGVCNSSGLCECATGEIYLVGETECGECGTDVDAIICKNYTATSGEQVS